jgi:carboxylate-amine ligase
VRSLFTTNTIQEAMQICWDLRLCERYPTLEFRVPDMCMTVEEAVLMAGLARGLVVEKFLEFVRPALEEFGEWEEVYAIALLL